VSLHKKYRVSMTRAYGCRYRPSPSQEYRGNYVSDAHKAKRPDARPLTQLPSQLPPQLPTELPSQPPSTSLLHSRLTHESGLAGSPAQRPSQPSVPLGSGLSDQQQSIFSQALHQHSGPEDKGHLQQPRTGEVAMLSRVDHRQVCAAGHDLHASQLAEQVAELREGPAVEHGVTDSHSDRRGSCSSRKVNHSPHSHQSCMRENQDDAGHSASLRNRALGFNKPQCGAKLLARRALQGQALNRSVSCSKCVGLCFCLAACNLSSFLCLLAAMLLRCNGTDC